MTEMIEQQLIRPSGTVLISWTSPVDFPAWPDDPADAILGEAIYRARNLPDGEWQECFRFPDGYPGRALLA